MTRITFQDGKVVLRDGKVGTEDACCCGECVCPECEGLNVSVTIEFCGRSVALTIPVPGTDFGRDPIEPGPNDPFDPDADYLIVSGDMTCGELGPDEECGWFLSLFICYQCNNIQDGEGYNAFIPKGDDDCPQLGPVTLVCFGAQFNSPCVTSVTASVG